MKSVLLALLCTEIAWLGVQVQVLGQESGFYDSRYDYLDIDTILDNKRLVKNYVDCLLNEKPCSPEGKALKRILPEGLRTKCARCTPRQKHTALEILRRLRSEHPDQWKRIVARWDPTGDLTRRFEDYLEKDDNNKIGYEKPIEPQPKPQKPTRFAPADEVQPSSSEMRPTIRSVPSSSMRMPTNDIIPISTTVKEETTTSTPYKPPTKSKMKTVPTRKPYNYNTLPPPIKVDLTPIYAGTMGLIDHFGNKIIRTTELVTDLLRNTVRVVAGAKYK